MSFAILSEAYDETRRLAIAGSGLAIDDYRLQKLIAPLEKAGEKAPVFARVAAAIQKVVKSDKQHVSQDLLELSTLLIAILYTQGKTGADGELAAIETIDLALPTTASVGQLRPLIEALTRPGSGRLRVIRDAHERRLFNDLRLVRPALGALDDVYGEIGDFVADKVLPTYGQAIVPLVRESFDIKGKSGHARRLRLLHTLDPEGSQTLIEAALESGSKEMKAAATECLKSSQGRVTQLLDSTRAKAKDVRKVALGAIARLSGASRRGPKR